MRSNVTDPGVSADAFFALPIARVEPETRDAVVVTFDVPPGLRERFRYEAGQYLTLRTVLDGEEVRRAYSICTPATGAAPSIAIKRVADGRFSTWAHAELRAGATIEVAPPAGRFGPRIDPQAATSYLAVAAGSGITPILSVVATVLERQPQGRVTLVYANRATSTVMFRRELLDLKDRYLGRFAPLFVMSREPQDADLFSGRLERAKCDALFERWIDVAAHDVALICGPDAVAGAVADALAAHGMAPERIRTERFASAGSAPRAVRRPAPAAGARAGTDGHAYVLVDGRRRDFPFARAGETLLEAGLRAGVELPYSCKGGVCSTCRAKLVAGEVDMDVRYALEDYEIARGFILLCQSYPATAEIGVDLDARSVG